MSLFLDHIRKHIDLSSEAETFLLGLMHAHTYAKKSYLQQAGDPCQWIHFVIEGTVRAYYLSQEGKDSTIMFATRDWWITDMDSFINGRTAVVHIQAISDTRVLSLSRSGLDQLYQEFPEFNQFFRILMQNAYCREQRRSLQTLTMTAKERYDQFMTKYPEVAGQVTQKQIASYLGITPEFLSYLRSLKD